MNPELLFHLVQQSHEDQQVQESGWDHGSSAVCAYIDDQELRGGASNRLEGAVRNGVGK